MIKDVIDELVDYIENCTYIDKLQILNNEKNILRKYDSAWSDKVDKVVRVYFTDDFITTFSTSNRYAIHSGQFNDMSCYIKFFSTNITKSFNHLYSPYTTQ